MPRNARVVAPGFPYHITQRGSNRQPVFFSQSDRKLYLRLLRENLSDAGVRILAYCLMTNHVHLIAVPAREDSLAILFSRAHGRYSQALNIRRGRSGHLWQARYHSCPIEGAHLWMAIRYVEENPCRAGLVARAEDYRWSSAAVHLRGQTDTTGILDTRFWTDAGGIATWQELHGQSLLAEDVYRLRKSTYAGRPFGTEEFLKEMEDRFQRKWSRRWMGSARISAQSA
jgi:putative transposase